MPSNKENESGKQGNQSGSTRGGSSEQHAKAGSQSHKSSDSDKGSSSTRGGTSEQHAKAGSQSHKK